MKFHDTLNKKLWNGWELKPEVADKLEEISELFIEYLDIPVEAIKDIRITGSSANYNYTDHSDLDLHVIVDYDKIHEDCPVVEGFLWGYKQAFNSEHDISIYGVPVELYAEDSRTSAVSNGIFSLMNNEWIKKPEKLEPTDNDAAVEAKFKELKEACDRCDDSEEAQKLLDKIYAMRKSGLAEEGEVSTENLAFKKLRDAGCLDRLREIKKEQIDKNLSLESYQLSRVERIKYSNLGMKKKKIKNNQKLQEKDISTYLDTSNSESYLRKFLQIHANLIDPEPMDYTGDTDIEAILYYLGSEDGLVAKIKSPIETIVFDENNLTHLLIENESQRVKDLNKVIETIKNPNLIIETKEGKLKHNYIKAFNTGDILKSQLVVVKVAADGSFYVTTFRLKNRKFFDKLKNGQIIYDLSDTYASENNSPYNNIIDDNTNKINSPHHEDLKKLKITYTCGINESYYIENKILKHNNLIISKNTNKYNLTETIRNFCKKVIHKELCKIEDYEGNIYYDLFTESYTIPQLLIQLRRLNERLR